MDNIQKFLFGKTSAAHSTPTEVLTSGSSLTKWLKQGRWSLNGQSWMRNIGCPNDEGACSSSLSLMLQSPQDVQTHYSLSRKACVGILKRQKLRRSIQQTANKTPIKLGSPQRSNLSLLCALLESHLNQENLPPLNMKD